MWADALEQFCAAFDAAWAQPDLYTSSPDQLRNAYAVITNADRSRVTLLQPAKDLADHPDLKHLHQLRVEENIKNIKYQRHDIESFYRNELGTPCPVAVEQTEASDDKPVELIEAYEQQQFEAELEQQLAKQIDASAATLKLKIGLRVIDKIESPTERSIALQTSRFKPGSLQAKHLIRPWPP